MRAGPMESSTSASQVESSHAGPTGSYKWLVVFMLWWVCFFNYADRQSIFAIFPTLEAEFGFSKFQLGLIGSAFMWVYAFGAPLAGFVGDRVRRKDLILGGCLFWRRDYRDDGLVSDSVAVRRGAHLEGFGETFYFPASMSLTSDYHGPRTRSRAPVAAPIERLPGNDCRQLVGAGWRNSIIGKPASTSSAARECCWPSCCTFS